MNVLLVGPTDANGRFAGGIQSVCNTILDNHRYFDEYNISLFSQNSCILKRKPKTMGKFSISNILNVLKLSRIIVTRVVDENIDVVYLHTSTRFALLKDLLLSRMLHKKNGVKIIVHIHYAEKKNILFNNILDKVVKRIFDKSVSGTVFLSEETRKEFLVWGLQETKTKTIYNFHNYDISKQVISQKIEELQNCINLVFLGSIDERKGILEVLKALNEIDLDFKLHVCGKVNQDSIQNQFDSLISKLGSKVVFHGFISGEDKINILNNSHVMILYSKAEGLPISLLEGVAFGNSLFTTNVGAIPEIFDKNNGVVTSVLSSQELEKLLRFYLADKETLKNNIIYNYDYSNKFTPKVFIEQLSEFILQIKE